MIKCNLAGKMRHLREHSHLTQAEVAKHLNVERQTYCNYENEYRTPPLEFVVRLADFYKVSLDYLLREEVGSPSSIPTQLSSAEAAYLEAFRLLTAQNQKEVLQFIQFKTLFTTSEQGV